MVRFSKHQMNILAVKVVENVMVILKRVQNSL